MLEKIFIDAIPDNAMHGSYMPHLVVLSYIVASFGSYTGLALASEYSKAESFRLKSILLFAGAAAMGFAIWSMHFIGMLAYRMDMPMTHDPVLTGLSMLIAVAIAFYFFKAAATTGMSTRRLAASAILMGGAICGMHYAGMAAMEIKFTTVRYLPWLFAASVVIAVTASAAALMIFNRIENYNGSCKKRMLRGLAALVMGAAICGMHYTGMAAAVFIPEANMCLPAAPDFTAAQDNNLAIIIASVTGIMIAIALSLRIFKTGRAFFAGNDGDMSFPIRILSFALISTVFLLVAFGFAWHGQNALIDKIQEVTSLQDRLHVADAANPFPTDTTQELVHGIKDMAESSDRQFDRLAFLLTILAPAIMISWIGTILGLKKWQENISASKRQAEKANAAKSEFLANMSHDLRTPLNGILGLSQLIAANSTNAEQGELVRAIIKSGESLLFLLNDILDFSKMEAGELSLEEAPFNLKEGLQNVINLLSPLASEKGLVINYNYCDMAPPFVVGDAMRVNQIITNLVGNAIKFTESGHIDISVEAEPMVNAGISTYQIKVADTGIGIAPEVQGRLFNKFEQGDASRSRKYGGTGLGLAICRMLVGKMQGVISFKSAPGEGTVFKVLIPFQTATAKAIVRAGMVNAPPLRNEIDFGRFRVLVVDDHPVNRLVADKLLRKMGFTNIDEAVNGAEALQRINTAALPYDIILMDCQMPQMDGFEATRQIRELEKNAGAKHIPIVAMTAHAMVGDRVECLRAGMDDYLSKPIKPESLRTSLSHWLLDAQKAPTQQTAEKAVAAPVTSKQDAVVDLTHLALFTEGEKDNERLMADMFLSSGVEIVGALRLHLQGANTDSDWKMASHKLKGAALQIGAIKLASACLTAESLHDTSLLDKENIFEDIERRFSEVQAFFAAR